MVLRAFLVSFGIVSGAGFSQFPEFSQQYLQRLGGAVDELSTVVSDFDRSAATFGMTRRIKFCPTANGCKLGFNNVKDILPCGTFNQIYSFKKTVMRVAAVRQVRYLGLLSFEVVDPVKGDLLRVFSGCAAQCTATCDNYATIGGRTHGNGVYIIVTTS